jgi:FMN phosphatase YigB (HAD superfamily)
MAIKAVAWDVYGTIIAHYHDEVRDDCESEPLKARQGALEALAELESKGIVQVTCSDGDLAELKKDLAKAGIRKEFFNDFFKMQPYQQKDFSYILQEYDLAPEELLIIGDNWDIDIALAQKQGCKTLWVPEGQEINFQRIIELL